MSCMFIVHGSTRVWRSRARRTRWLGFDPSGIEFSELGLKFSGIEFNKLEFRRPKFSGIESGSADLISADSSSENSRSGPETERIDFFGDPSSMLREPETWILGPPGRQEEVCGLRRSPKIGQVGPGGGFHHCHRCFLDPTENPGLHRMQILSAGPRDLRRPYREECRFYRWGREIWGAGPGRWPKV